MWLYPRTWRDRYGREMVELLAVSKRPWRDGVNIAVHAALAWTEVAMVKVIILIVAAASLMLFGFTLGQLAGGVHEIPQHWWSSSMTALAIAAVTLAIVTLTRTHSTDRA
jgi:NADH:ubiquinone oxidoreductase subunit 6 (subunit J)